jgi:hypothetical protein
VLSVSLPYTLHNISCCLLGGFQTIQISNFVHINAIVYMGPKESEPPLPRHLAGNVAPRTSVTCLEKCGRAPSCWWPLVKLFQWRNVEVQHSVLCLLCIGRQSIPKAHHHFWTLRVIQNIHSKTKEMTARSFVIHYITCVRANVGYLVAMVTGICVI